jgi:DNA polymerase-4
MQIVGRAAGRHLHALAHNRDPRRVEPRRRRRSVGAQRALGRRPKTAELLDSSLIGLVDRVTRRLRAARRVGRTVVLRLRFDDFSRATRSQTLPQATAESQAILAAVRELYAESRALIRRRGLTLVGITVTNLEDDRTIQLALPLFPPRWYALDAAVDEVRLRFGPDAVMRGVLLGRDQGIAMPLLPD